ncbi:MAG TPA: hypothetical protein VNC18_17540 [Gemmatimonadaceae bacterium]|nr:hypothetical protein [Gemmatimonadaceae bacterium]
MADIRTTPELTLFPQANENPLSGGGDWAQVDSVDYPLQLQCVNHQAQGDDVFFRDVFSSRWTPLSLTGDIQVWGLATANIDVNQSYSLRLFANTGGAGGVLDGYIVNFTAGSPVHGALLFRMDNGTATQIDVAGSSQFIAADTLFLLQTVGTHVQTYYSHDAGQNWTLLNDVVDNTYRSNLALVLVTINSTSFPHWGQFGGGLAGSLNRHVQLPFMGVGP